MLDLFKSKKSKMTESHQELLEQTKELLEAMVHKIDLRFNELSSQVREVELSVKELEVKLLTKDLRDKQQLGALHYKLHERKNPTLESDIEGLKVELTSKKRPTRDQ